MDLYHYGTPRHSGRYPWGSGENPHQNNVGFLGYVNDLHKQGMTEVEIAKGLGMTTSELRAKKSIAKADIRKENVSQAIKLKEKGYSNVEIGKRMGINESSVRSLLNPVIQKRSEITKTTSDMLKENVKTKGYIDVGAGVENHLGISRTRLKTAIAMLKEEGYTIHYIPVTQLGTGKKTTVMTLAGPDVGFSEVYANKDKIKLINDYSEDGGRTFLGLDPINNIDSKRLMIRHVEDGGGDKDGVIELRRGVDDISLGSSKYAQVRIGVDGTHYLKGMAMYSDDMPKGIDLIFNTNKSKTLPKNDIMKDMKEDDDNPFGAVIRQKHYIDKDGKRQTSALNIVNEEGDWNRWSKNLSSQFLSKQSPALAKKQLDLNMSIKKEEFDDIMKLTHPAIKKRLIGAFAEDCDSMAVKLKAAALPRQSTSVILPFPSMKEDEIYAPKYRNGERVILIRYPHGGIFEIPELTVNNRNQGAKSSIRNAEDAVGISPKVAARLSGADFDGDTVLVIPNPKNIGVKTSSALKGLSDFDPQESYPYVKGMKVMGEKGGGNTQQKMGDISNLITDMTIKGANTDEIAKAVRHSMVVIDAEKHKLNHTKSYIDNGIAGLKQKYQGGANRGASTLISRAESQTRVPQRKDRLIIDPKTGKKLYDYTGDKYIDKKGKEVLNTTKSTKMYEVDDAYELSSGTRMENVYADYANQMKALGNTSRKEFISIKPITWSVSAKETYAPEVASLKAQLNIALQNSPRERQAQLLANTVVAAKKKDNPSMDYDDIKKISWQALEEARNRVGAKKTVIDISDKEWAAIQAGAISNNELTKILNNTDLDRVKQLATPRTVLTMTPAKIAKAKTMLARGYTQAEVADSLGVSTGSISNIE